jgi:hypothetical protein
LILLVRYPLSHSTHAVCGSRFVPVPAPSVSVPQQESSRSGHAYAAGVWVKPAAHRLPSPLQHTAGEERTSSLHTFQASPKPQPLSQTITHPAIISPTPNQQASYRLARPKRLERSQYTSSSSPSLSRFCPRCPPATLPARFAHHLPLPLPLYLHLHLQRPPHVQITSSSYVLRNGQHANTQSSSSWHRARCALTPKPPVTAVALPLHLRPST